MTFFFISHNALHSTQSGFRPYHSCKTALLQTINFHEAINNGQIIDMVMVDFRTAFNLGDHTLLLRKLRHYKISNKTLLWFLSYLLNRQQKVVINDNESKYEKICLVSHRAQFWDLCYFLCSQLICLILQAFKLGYFANIFHPKENFKSHLLRDVCTLCSRALVSDSLLHMLVLQTKEK